MTTYKEAGVDIDAGNELVRRIKAVAPRIGGFSDGIPLPKGLKDPVLVGCADGVGTKLAIAQALNRHDGIGFDLVGMNVNDLICSGARPLFFLDYFACGKLDVGLAERVVKGIARACHESGCDLLGGETAEMPGFYKPGEYDLAGFATGVVERKKMLKPRTHLRAGDVLLGLPSSGLHSNGFSLVRRIFKKHEWRRMGTTLLAPTRLYVRDVLRVLEEANTGGRFRIRGLVHVTGGGFIDNIPRILPDHLSAVITEGGWPIPPIFRVIQKRAALSDREMFRTFNMGIGMVIAVAPDAAAMVRKRLRGAVSIGVIEKGDGDVRFR